MKKSSFRRLIAAISSSLLLSAAASTPAHSTPPECQYPAYCEWEFECLYTGPDGELVWSCRLIYRCYC